MVKSGRQEQKTRLERRRKHFDVDEDDANADTDEDDEEDDQAEEDVDEEEESDDEFENDEVWLLSRSTSPSASKQTNGAAITAVALGATGTRRGAQKQCQAEGRKPKCIWKWDQLSGGE